MRLERFLKHEGILGQNTIYYWSDDETNKMEFQERVNFLGEQGWEVITCAPIEGNGGSTPAGIISYILVLLKRPKQ